MWKFLFMGIVHSATDMDDNSEYCCSYPGSFTLFGSVYFVLSRKEGKNLCDEYTNEECAFIVARYFRTNSFKRVQELFQNRFLNCRMPNKSAIQGTVKRFRIRFQLLVFTLADNEHQPQIYVGNSQNRCRYGGSEHNFFLIAENGVLIFFNI